MKLAQSTLSSTQSWCTTRGNSGGDLQGSVGALGRKGAEVIRNSDTESFRHSSVRAVPVPVPEFV